MAQPQRVAGAEANHLEEDRENIEISVLSEIRLAGTAHFGNHTLSRKESMPPPR